MNRFKRQMEKNLNVDAGTNVRGRNGSDLSLTEQLEVLLCEVC